MELSKHGSKYLKTVDDKNPALPIRKSIPIIPIV